MRGGSWRFIVQYNRTAEQNTIKGRQPYPRNINLAGLWSTWGLLHETPWPREGKGFQLHLLTLSRAAVSAGSPSSPGSLSCKLALPDISVEIPQDIQPGEMDGPVDATLVMPSPSQSVCQLFFQHVFHALPLSAHHIPPLIFQPQRLKVPQTAGRNQVCVL